MEGTIVPVRLEKVWEKRYTSTDYSGKTAVHYYDSVRVRFVESGETRDFAMFDSSCAGTFSHWLKDYYEERGDGMIGDQVFALLDEDGNVITFGESKRNLACLEESDL